MVIVQGILKGFGDVDRRNLGMAILGSWSQPLLAPVSGRERLSDSGGGQTLITCSPGHRNTAMANIGCDVGRH